MLNPPSVTYHSYPPPCPTPPAAPCRNADGRIHLFYSTPEAYSAAKYAEGLAWPLKEDDFFPYADGPHQYWTGYFTSRPALKRYIRSTSAFFQAVRQVVAPVPPLTLGAYGSDGCVRNVCAI